MLNLPGPSAEGISGASTLISVPANALTVCDPARMAPIPARPDRRNCRFEIFFTVKCFDRYGILDTGSGYHKVTL